MMLWRSLSGHGKPLLAVVEFEQIAENRGKSRKIEENARSGCVTSARQFGLKDR
jgi:hypothetical protein